MIDSCPESRLQLSRYLLILSLKSPGHAEAAQADRGQPACWLGPTEPAAVTSLAQPYSKQARHSYSQFVFIIETELTDGHRQLLHLARNQT